MTRWGIIGAGNIAHRFSESLKNVEGCELYAISGRNEEKLQAFAKDYPCQNIYVGHDNLLADPNVDAVYIALPHYYHYEWIVKAAQCKKDILVEKPAVVTHAQALEVKKAVEDNQVVFMEAMKNVYEPAFVEVYNHIQNGEIGKVIAIDVQHGFTLPVEHYGKTYHTSAEGGGCLYDIGCYGLGLLAPFVKGEPVFEKTYANRYPKTGIDLYVQSKMTIDDVKVNLTFAFDRNLEAYGEIHGEKGSIKVSPLHRPNHYEITIDGKTTSHDVPYVHDDFYGEIAYFEKQRQTRNCKDALYTIDDTIQTSIWSDAIRQQFSDYDENDLAVLEEQEKTFTIEHMTSQFALDIGNAIISFLPEYDRGISCQVIRESDKLCIFQYITDDKKASNLMYAEGKHQACYVYGHSSAWVYVAKCMDSPLYDEIHDEVLPSGGAFPLHNASGELIGSVLVSGLHEGKDHELIIRALEKVAGKKAPQFKKAIG